MIRVLVVATSTVARAGLSAALELNPRITVVGTVADLDVLGSEVELYQPDVILLDLGDSSQPSAWSKLNRLQTNQIRSSIPIALYDWEGIDLDAAIEAGVRGILPDTSTELELGAAVEAIALGLVVLHPSVMDLFALRGEVRKDSLPVLTSREIEVLIQIAAGLSNKAIGQNLHISEHTVKFHISSIFQKLGVSTRTEAVTAGVRMGLILL
jgi:DNA-binding NarL/FixJ family response regulator